MDVLIGLIGVVLGWALASVSERWRERREGRTAAVLVMAELDGNLTRLQAMRERAFFTSQLSLRTESWPTQVTPLGRIASQEVVLRVAEAYAACDYANTALGLADRLKQALSDLGRAQGREGEDASADPNLLDAIDRAGLAIATAIVGLAEALSGNQSRIRSALRRGVGRRDAGGKASST
jgi:hypothetical protein